MSVVSKTDPAAAGTRRAIVQGLAAVGAGVGNNALVQMLSSLPTAQIVILRAASTIILLAPLVVVQGLRIPTRIAVIRGALEAAGTLLLVIALVLSSLSFVSTIMMIIPVGVMSAASVFIGEPISWRGRVLVLLSFGAALLATAPVLSSNTTGAASAICSALCYIARDLLTRKYPTIASSFEMSLLASGLTLLAIFLVFDPARWQPVPMTLWPTVGGMVILYVVSNLLIVAATRHGPATLVASTRYSAVIWAVLFDLALFKHIPTAMTLAAAGAIILCGLGLTFTERRSHP